MDKNLLQSLSQGVILGFVIRKSVVNMDRIRNQSIRESTSWAVNVVGKEGGEISPWELLPREVSSGETERAAVAYCIKGDKREQVCSETWWYHGLLSVQ